MRNHVFAVATILLVTPSSFTTPQTPAPKQAAPTSASRPSQEGAKEKVPESCPITKPPVNAFIPPSPYPSKGGDDRFWYGTNKLWISLRTDGTWWSLPHWPDGTYRQKLFWWSEGYDWHRELQPMLKITGERLDSPAPALATDEHANNGWTDDPSHPFIVTGINLPTLGCWKLTGRYRDAELSFVVWVTP